jgi:hypothetical protein
MIISKKNIEAIFGYMNILLFFFTNPCLIYLNEVLLLCQFNRALLDGEDNQEIYLEEHAEEHADCQSSRPCNLAGRIKRPESAYNYDIDTEENNTSNSTYQNIYKLYNSDDIMI